MTGVLAWLTLAGWAATATTGKRIGRHLRWTRRRAATAARNADRARDLRPWALPLGENTHA